MAVMSEEQKFHSTLKDRIKGIIYGAALGDGVGLATEFMNKQTAQILYGNGPIQFGFAKGHEFYRDGHRNRWHTNDFTDDTDQLLLILQCLLNSNGTLIPQHFAFRLKEWTEIGFPELSNKLACGVGMTVGSTLGHPNFLQDPHQASFQVWDRMGRNMAANGALMRTSGLGIPFFWDEFKVAQNAIVCAKVTHADPRSIFSSVVASVLISRVLCLANQNVTSTNNLNSEMKTQLINLMESGITPNENNCDSSPAPKELPKEKPSSTSFLKKVKNMFRNKDSPSIDIIGWPNHKEQDKSRLQNPVKIDKRCHDFKEVDTQFEQLAKQVTEDYKFLLDGSPKLSSDKSSLWVEDLEKYCSNMDTKKHEDFKLDERRTIGYTYKCLGSALFCFTRRIPYQMDEPEFFKELITQLALEAGDADTNCAVGGALLGARLGFNGLPNEWKKGIRHAEFLNEICDQLVQLVMLQWHQLPACND